MLNTKELNNMRCKYTNKGFVELPKYVYKSKNGFEIRKRIGNRVEYFGRFNDLETAIDELQVCQECNWDIDLMVEL